MATNVLFICVHNSARSQMAEAFLKQLAGDGVFTESAGYIATSINPLVVKAMAEVGIDLSGKGTQSVFSLVRKNIYYGYIITVCNRAQEEDCPVFPGVSKKIHWDLENPEDFTGTEEEILMQIRGLRDRIKKLVETFIQDELS